ncbi:Hachiman antiphage defense system protein HamA [Paenarthrobacter sp. NPDC058040]|uniref:Hachiman antiphage defense system protein HamA n=1 Tax=unclassified Paenarthrobacter TaxID=2634190 RepID=UPI0036DBF56D
MTTTQEDVGPHKVVRMVPADDVAVDIGVKWAAAAVPRHYVSADEIAVVLNALGKPQAAEVLSGKLPLSKRTRSGELGEVLATQYVARELGYRMIARLRWKDSREMPMRGDDLLGIRMADDKLEFLKGEAKSRTSLSTSTLDEAETALLSEHGLPTPHAMMFVAARLREMGETNLYVKILAAQLHGRIRSGDVTHLLFTFSGNSPLVLLRNHTNAYKGEIRRLGVGLQVPEHQLFIRRVFEKVIRDAYTA